MPAAPQAEGVRVEDGRLVVFRAVENAGEFLGTVYLRAHYERNRRLKHYLAVLALVAAVSLALALLSNGLFLLTVVIRPILAVSDVARRITTTPTTACVRPAPPTTKWPGGGRVQRHARRARAASQDPGAGPSRTP